MGEGPRKRCFPSKAPSSRKTLDETLEALLQGSAFSLHVTRRCRMRPQGQHRTHDACADAAAGCAAVVATGLRQGSNAMAMVEYPYQPPLPLSRERGP